MGSVKVIKYILLSNPTIKVKINIIHLLILPILMLKEYKSYIHSQHKKIIIIIVIMQLCIPQIIINLSLSQ